jgi:site-specific recombinase XerD
MTKGYIINNFSQYLIGKKYAESSVKGYSFGLASFLEFQIKNNHSSEDFNNQDILDFRNSLGGAGQTINLKLSAVKKYCEYLKVRRNIIINYDAGFIKTTNKKKISLVNSFEEILEYIKTVQTNKLICQRDSLIFKFLYYLGLRVNELIEIKKSDVSGGNLLYKDKEIIINNNIINDLDNYFRDTNLKNSDYLFFSAAARKVNFAKHLTVKSIEDIFNKYIGFLDQKISISDLRHSYTLKNQSQGEVIDSIYKHQSINYQSDYLNLLK